MPKGNPKMAPKVRLSTVVLCVVLTIGLFWVMTIAHSIMDIEHSILTGSDKKSLS